MWNPACPPAGLLAAGGKAAPAPSARGIGVGRELRPGTWTTDPADSAVSLASRTLRRWSNPGRQYPMGVIHLDELPPVGVICFRQPSGRPVLSVALAPAGVAPGAADLDAMRRGPDTVDVIGPWWWTLRSESLEILPTGTWRIMATLTAYRSHGLVELRLEVDREAIRRDQLVLRGRGLLDRRAFAMGKRAWSLGSKAQLDLALRATPVGPAAALNCMKDVHLLLPG
jgi:hypothetical protein